MLEGDLNRGTAAPGMEGVRIRMDVRVVTVRTTNDEGSRQVHPAETTEQLEDAEPREGIERRMG